MVTRNFKRVLDFKKTQQWQGNFFIFDCYRQCATPVVIHHTFKPMKRPTIKKFKFHRLYLALGKCERESDWCVRTGWRSPDENWFYSNLVYMSFFLLRISSTGDCFLTDKPDGLFQIHIPICEVSPTLPVYGNTYFTFLLIQFEQYKNNNRLKLLFRRTIWNISCIIFLLFRVEKRLSMRLKNDF